MLLIHIFLWQETEDDLETSWEDSQDECEGNKDAARALMRVKQKLDGYEDGEMRSVHGQVNLLGINWHSWSSWFFLIHKLSSLTFTVCSLSICFSFPFCEETLIKIWEHCQISLLSYCSVSSLYFTSCWTTSIKLYANTRTAISIKDSAEPGFCFWIFFPSIKPSSVFKCKHLWAKK